MRKHFSSFCLGLAILAFCLHSANTPWAKDPMTGALSKDSEKILDNTYGFGLLSHASPPLQRWREGIARNVFTQECDKYGPRVRPQQADCVDCRKMEQEVGLSNKDFQALRQFLDENPGLESTTKAKDERSAQYDQWIWMTRAIRAQKEGMERARPYLKAMQEGLHEINKGTGSSDLLELHGNYRDLRNYVNQVKSNMARLAVIEAKVSGGKLSAEDQAGFEHEADVLGRQTPVIFQSNLHDWVEKAATGGNSAQGNKSAPDAETFIQHYLDQNSLNINKSMEAAVGNHLKLIEDKLPTFTSLIEDEAKLRKAYKDSPVGNAKEKYDIFVSKILHSVPLLEAVAGTDPEKVPGFERAGCDLRSRLSTLQAFREGKLTAVSVALGFGVTGAAMKAVSLFPRLSALGASALLVGSNAPAAASDFGIYFKEMAKKCDALGAQLAGGESADVSKQYMECWQANESAKNMAVGGYAFGAVTSAFQPALVKGAKAVAEKFLKDAGAFKPGMVSGDDAAKLTTVAADKLAEAQEKALTKFEREFNKKDLRAIVKQVQAEAKANGWSRSRIDEEVAARRTKAFQEKAASVRAKVEDGFNKTVKNAVEACNPKAGKPVSWADEIGMPWLMSSLDQSTPLHP